MREIVMRRKFPVGSIQGDTKGEIRDQAKRPGVALRVDQANDVVAILAWREFKIGQKSFVHFYVFKIQPSNPRRYDEYN